MSAARLCHVLPRALLLIFMGCVCGLFVARARAQAISPVVDGTRVQDAEPTDLSAQMQRLTEVLERTQSQLEESQRQLNEVRAELAAIRQQSKKVPVTASTTTTGTSPATASDPLESSKLAAALEELREQQALQQSEIASHEQAKVESTSKYPVKVTGLLLFNSFVNTSQVNVAASPNVALGGPGSTGASMKQTILGFDARGPHLFGATSTADLRVDFAGTAQSGSTSGGFAGPYASTAALLRLRTAHAALKWRDSEAFFSLDRPILSPDSPASLVAVSEPALAWSGSLWTWNPQLGIDHNVPLGSSTALRLQSSLIYAADAPLSPQGASAKNPPGTASTTAEQSRWPGIETRIALVGSGAAESQYRIGIGGYFAPHRLSIGRGFDSWAATIDSDLHLPAGFKFTANAYRGLALGGLGGGAYKDFAYYLSPLGKYYIRPLDSVGGWAQIKKQAGNRLEFNAAFGTDMVSAHELRPYKDPYGTIYQNLQATQTFTGNVIYSPSAFLLFSVEYRRLRSSPVDDSSAVSNIFGLAAGYKF